MRRQTWTGQAVYLQLKKNKIYNTSKLFRNEKECRKLQGNQDKHLSAAD